MGFILMIFLLIMGLVLGVYGSIKKRKILIVIGIILFIAGIYLATPFSLI